MEEQKKKIPTTTITRNTADFSQQTDNIYETVAMLTKRANQISINVKKDIQKTIAQCSSSIESMDEMFENREQIEKIKAFERLPKPTLVATEEYLDHELTYRNPAKEDQRERRMEELEERVIAEKEAQQ
ncbi:MAG: DNA-directed RNA polymerase subunit omega [Bacteroidales bacterium]|nr:DNA-directed RNA polymerase subunit omega [Bacteroidales bacterium]